MESTINESEQVANKSISLCLRITSIITFLCMTLVIAKVINIGEIDKISITLFVACILFILPTFIVDIFKISKPIIKYSVLFCAICGTLNVAICFGFTYQIMIILPTVLSIFYFNKKITVFTAGLTIFATLSYYVALTNYYKETADLLSQGRKYSLTNGFLPFALFYFLIALLSFIISCKTSSLLSISNKKAKSIDEQNNSLDKVISSSHEIFAARNISDFYENTEKALRDIIKPFIKNSEPSNYYFGYTIGKEVFKLILPNKTATTIRSIKDHIFLDMPAFPIVFSSERSDKTTAFEINEHCIVIKFFNDKGLIHFIVIDCFVTTSDITILNEILQILSNNIGIALKNLRLTLDLLETQSEMIYAFSRITDSKSHQTGNHIKRVSEYMKVLSRSAGYSDDYAEKIGIAAMMHDIGKIFIPQKILEKKNSLTPEEYSIIKTHVTKGVELIEKCPGDVMNLAKIMIKEHHERWDGTGYLEIKGNRIHTISRLISVADVFDALISKRSYKEGLPSEEVYQIIVSESGKQFDPRIVEIFKKDFKTLVKIYNEYKDDLKPNKVIPNKKVY